MSRCRQDSFIAVEDCCSTLRDMVDQYPLNPDSQSEERLIAAGISPQKARILVSDLCVASASRTPEWKHLGPYFIADVWSFGYTEDLLRYFDIRDGTLWNRGSGMPTCWPPESNLGCCWKNEIRLSDDMSLVEIFARYFVIADRDMALFFWPRWGDYDTAVKVGIKDFITRERRCNPERYSHSGWIRDTVSFHKY